MKRRSKICLRSRSSLPSSSIESSFGLIWQPRRSSSKTFQDLLCKLGHLAPQCICNAQMIHSFPELSKHTDNNLGWTDVGVERRLVVERELDAGQEC